MKKSARSSGKSKAIKKTGFINMNRMGSQIKKLSSVKEPSLYEIFLKDILDFQAQSFIKKASDKIN